MCALIYVHVRSFGSRSFWGTGSGWPCHRSKLRPAILHSVRWCRPGIGSKVTFVITPAQRSRPIRAPCKADVAPPIAGDPDAHRATIAAGTYLGPIEHWSQSHKFASTCVNNWWVKNWRVDEQNPRGVYCAFRVPRYRQSNGELPGGATLLSKRAGGGKYRTSVF